MSEIREKMGNMFAELNFKCVLGESEALSFLAEKRLDELEWLLGQCDFMIRERGPNPTHQPGTLNPELLNLSRECLQKELGKRRAR